MWKLIDKGNPGDDTIFIDGDRYYLDLETSKSIKIQGSNLRGYKYSIPSDNKFVIVAENGMTKEI